MTDPDGTVWRVADAMAPPTTTTQTGSVVMYGPGGKTKKVKRTDLAAAQTVDLSKGYFLTADPVKKSQVGPAKNYTLTTKTGAKIKVVDASGKTPPADLRTIARTIGTIFDRNPVPDPPTVRIVSKKLEGNADGWVYPSKPNEIYVAPVSVSSSALYPVSGKRLRQTIGVNGLSWVVAHEYGHVVAFQSKHDYPSAPSKTLGGLYDKAKKSPIHMSRYGLTNPSESYAEAFAAWSLSKEGSVGNPLVEEFADAFGWGQP